MSEFSPFVIDFCRDIWRDVFKLATRYQDQRQQELEEEARRGESDRLERAHQAEQSAAYEARAERDREYDAARLAEESTRHAALMAIAERALNVLEAAAPKPPLPLSDEERAAMAAASEEANKRWQAEQDEIKRQQERDLARREVSERADEQRRARMTNALEDVCTALARWLGSNAPKMPAPLPADPSAEAPAP